MALKEVNWGEYFSEIKSQCPWSTQAYKHNKILITEWHSHPQELGEYKAIVYTAENLSIRLLKKITERLNQMTDKEQFFWSHPRLGEYNTPIPAIIQQSREELIDIRNSLKLH